VLVDPVGARGVIKCSRHDLSLASNVKLLRHARQAALKTARRECTARRKRRAASEYSRLASQPYWNAHLSNTRIIAGKLSRPKKGRV
jgi:hypothetical protein